MYWEIGGVAFIILMGGLLHFAFEWSGGWKPLALFAAVNESLWEHLKLAFWPALLWALIEWLALGKVYHNFLIAKTVSFYVTPLAIIALVTGYTAIIGRHLLPVDILIFCLAVAGGQLVSYYLLSRENADGTKIIFVMLLTLIIVAFGLFTFYPPDMPLFVDPLTGQRGILTKGNTLS